MAFKRDDAVAVALADGRVLIAGGWDGAEASSLAEIYDPTTGQFSQTGSLGVARSGASGVLLDDGRVLVVGGWVPGDRATDVAEIYDPATGLFSPAGTQRVPRATGIAVRLNDGRVLIAGGANQNTDLDTAEIYDPATGTFTATDSMATRRYGLMAALLDDGRVLVMGGWNGLANLASAEIYDPTTGRFKKTQPMNERRQIGMAITMPDGRVLVAGGWNEDNPESERWTAASSVELFDPATEAFTVVGDMSNVRTEGGIALVGGMVLICCGTGQQDEVPLGTADLFDPATDQLTHLDVALTTPRSGPPMVVALSDGSVLIAGGWAGEDVTGTAEIFGL